MTARTRRTLLVLVIMVLGALAGSGVGISLNGDTTRYHSAATIAVVPAPGLPDDLAADFWQVLSEEQVVRTAASIYGSDNWAVDAADALRLPRSDVDLTASALVDTTLVEVTVEANSAVDSEAALNAVLGSASVVVSEILSPFVISEAAVRPAEPARATSAGQFIGMVAVAGALVGAGVGLGLAALLPRRARRTGRTRRGARRGSGGQGHDTDADTDTDRGVREQSLEARHSAEFGSAAGPGVADAMSPR